MEAHEQLILQALRDAHSNQLTANQLADIFECDLPEVQEHLDRMVLTGKLSLVSRTKPPSRHRHEFYGIACLQYEAEV